MIIWIRQLLAPPVFEDQDRTRVASPLNAILLTILAASVAAPVWMLVSQGVPTTFDEWFTLLGGVTIGAMCVGLLLLLRRGHVRMAGALLSSAVWVIITSWIYSSGGIRDTAVTGYFLVVIIAGLILGGRAAITFGLACILAAVGAFYAQASGVIVVPTKALHPFDLIVLVLTLGIAVLLLRFAVRSTAEAFEHARRNERAMTESNRDLQREIAERKRAEEELRESEERFRTLSGVAEEGIAIHNYGVIVDANEALARMLGYDLSEMIGSYAERFATPESWKIILKHIAAGYDKPYEVIGVRKDGSTFHCELVGKPYQHRGKTLRVAVFRNVTERKRAEESLRESERRFRDLFDGIPACCWVFDREGTILHWNRACEELYGWTAEQAVGKTMYDLMVKDENVAPTQETIAAVFQGQSFYGLEYEDWRADGTTCAVLVSEYPLRDASGQVIMGICAELDITERKQVEAEREQLLAQVQEQARQVQQIVDTVPEGVLLLDDNGGIVLANPVAERDLAVLADAKVGDTLVHLGDRPLAELLTLPPKGLWHEVVVDGRSFQIIARPLEVGAESGGWVLVTRDVTQQREIEQRIQQQERLAAVGQLAAGIAHDFNNIMATIVLYAQMTARMGGLSATVRKRMETIDQQAKHATKLIQQILDFGRRAVLERRPLDLLPLLKEQTKLLERTLPESIEIKLACGPDEYTINADPTRMQQMITNLALNARDAMPEGGELRIGLERIKVRPGESPLLPEMEVGEWVQVTVSDTGTGIPSDVLPHIFDPFFTTKEPGKGSGLGLPQVYGIVGSHEGRIDVETQVGQGTTFTIYLPALLGHPAEPPTAVLPKGLPDLIKGHGETILVVEDDAVTRKTLTESLEGLNYRVLEAANGEEALVLLEQSPPLSPPLGGRKGGIALVLSDVVMPEMGGIALLHAIRERGLAVRVVMLTGHPLARELENLRAQGMTDWLPKPPSLEQLAEAVAQAINEERPNSSI